jgi:hypothetical protein
MYRTKAAKERRGYVVPPMKRVVARQGAKVRSTGKSKKPLKGDGKGRTYRMVANPDAGKRFEKKVGKKHEVMLGYAYQTEGGVKKSGLTTDSRGRVVFKSRQAHGRKQKVYLTTGGSIEDGGIPIFDARGAMTSAGRAHSQAALAKGQRKGKKEAAMRPYGKTVKPKTTSKKYRDVTSGTLYADKKPRVKKARKTKKSKKPRKKSKKPRKKTRKTKKSTRKTKKSTRKPRKTVRRNPSRAAKSKSAFAMS